MCVFTFAKDGTTKHFFRSHQQTTDDITAFLGFIAKGKRTCDKYFFDITHRLNISLTTHNTLITHVLLSHMHVKENKKNKHTNKTHDTQEISADTNNGVTEANFP